MSPPASETSTATLSIPSSSFQILSNGSAPTQDPHAHASQDSVQSAVSGAITDASQNMEARESLSKTLKTLQFVELKNWVSSHAASDASLSKLRNKNGLSFQVVLALESLT